MGTSLVFYDIGYWFLLAAHLCVLPACFWPAFLHINYIFGFYTQAFSLGWKGGICITGGTLYKIPRGLPKGHRGMGYFQAMNFFLKHHFHRMKGGDIHKV